MRPVSILWQTELGRSSDQLTDASGGGLAVRGTQLFVTTGFGTVVALDTASGAQLWSQDLASYGGASPTVYEDLLYIAARDGAAWAIDTTNGRTEWQLAGPTGCGQSHRWAGTGRFGQICSLSFWLGRCIGLLPQGWAAVLELWSFRGSLGPGLNAGERFDRPTGY